MGLGPELGGEELVWLRFQKDGSKQPPGTHNLALSAMGPGCVGVSA